MTRRSLLAVALLFLLLEPVRPVAAATSEPWTWPLPGRDVDQRFDKPESAYGPGHRGVDLSASAGTTVRAVAAGSVSFVGRVAGVQVVTIDHGRERSTYQPVRSSLLIGDSVAAGEPIGTLLGTPSHCAGPCLHLGRVVGEGDYLDPLELLASGRFRLIDPNGTPPEPPAGGNGSLDRPVGGPITSAYGMRVHPVTGKRKLHDGTDFGVACGTPVHAAAGGTVVKRSTSNAYGKRLIIRHRRGFETSYNHLRSQSVSIGDHVSAGEVVGRSGNTGLSTGCHLHFMVTSNGHAVNPANFL